MRTGGSLDDRGVDTLMRYLTENALATQTLKASCDATILAESDKPWKHKHTGSRRCMRAKGTQVIALGQRDHIQGVLFECLQ